MRTCCGRGDIVGVVCGIGPGKAVSVAGVMFRTKSMVLCSYQFCKPSSQLFEQPTRANEGDTGYSHQHNSHWSWQKGSGAVDMKSGISPRQVLLVTRVTGLGLMKEAYLRHLHQMTILYLPCSNRRVREVSYEVGRLAVPGANLQICGEQHW